MMKHLQVFLIVLLALTASCDRKGGGDERGVRAATEAYEKAFKEKDAKALAALWTEDANYVIPETGEVITGRDDIEDHFDEMFKIHVGAELAIDTKSITFPTDSTAIEIATATLNEGGVIIDESAFKAFYKKVDGKWLIDEVREVPFAGAPIPSEQLSVLEWLVGEWIDEDEDVTIVSRYSWNKHKTFLRNEFSVTVEGSFDLEGKAIIGWDPINKTIRSWLFDSDGGFGEGTWKKQDDSWVIETSQTLADGCRASAINIITPAGHDKYTWQSTGRSVDGELLPDVEPVTVIRK